MMAASSRAPVNGRSDSQTSTPPAAATTYDPVNDTALKSAWERLEKYDTAALRQKNTHVRLRVVVLVLGFVASVLSVFISNSIPKDSPGYDAGRWALFIVPLVAAGIMAYATQAIPNQMWVKHRFSAEMIRRAIFLYRMNAGNYYDKPLPVKQKMLLDVLKDADTYSADALVDIFSPPSEMDAPTFAAALKKVSGSDGKTLNLEDYIRLRLEQQSRWYIDKSHYEHRSMNRWQVAGLFIGSAGSLLTFGGQVAWVAVTTSAAVTVNTLANLRMYGRTYFLYSLTARRLRQLRDEWNIQPAEYRVDPANLSAFVDAIESCFQSEIERWVEQAQDALSESEMEIARGLAQAEPSQTTATLTAHISATAPTAEEAIQEVTDAAEDLAEHVVENATPRLEMDR